MGTDFRLLRRLAVGIVAVLATMLVACSDDDALPTDPMAKSYKAEVRDGVVSLLHVSDVHGSSNGLLIIRRDIMPVSNDVVIVNTGDLESHRPKVKYPEVLSWMVSQWNVSHSDRPFLLVKGNHDACDIEFPGENGYTTGTEHQANATAHLLKPVMDGLVVWGDPSGVGGYWHKDIVTNGVKLRIIGIDEYEHSVGTPAALEGEDHSMRYSKIYSPAQIDWLENLLKNTPSDYYIVMCHHAPLYKFHPPEVLNDFVHHGIVGQFDSSFQKYYSGSMSFYRDGNIDLMARIIDAYQHRRGRLVAGCRCRLQWRGAGDLRVPPVRAHTSRLLRVSPLFPQPTVPHRGHLLANPVAQRRGPGARHQGRIELSAQPRDHRHQPQRGGRGALWGKRTEE